VSDFEDAVKSLLVTAGWSYRDYAETGHRVRPAGWEHPYEPGKVFSISGAVRAQIDRHAPREARS
jgi:hypothetical protein